MDPLDTSAIKVIEIVGVSTASFEDAVRHAVEKAAVSINGITSVEVVGQSATVRDGAVARFEARVKLSFVVR
jgi:flavin-binding protein dodecin